MWQGGIFHEVTGEKIVLRRFTMEDITPEYISWLNDPEVVRYSNQRFTRHTRETCTQYLKSFEKSPNLFLSVRAKEGATAIGTMTAYVSPHHGTVDMGIMIGKGAARGQGLGQDAWNTLLAWFIGRDEIRKVTAGTMRANGAMLRLMEKAGMQHEATRVGQELLDGVPQDILYYAKFPDR